MRAFEKAGPTENGDTEAKLFLCWRPRRDLNPRYRRESCSGVENTCNLLVLLVQEVQEMHPAKGLLHNYYTVKRFAL